MIKQVQAEYNPPELEKKIQKLWKDNDTYAKTKQMRAEGEDYYFVDGPPYTTGYIHLGTAWNKTIKDSIIRYKRMCGYNVRDQPGFDMHGLPIEVKVEQSIGIKSKKEIESFGIDNFISKCKDFALSHQEMMTDQFKELGIWMDWDRPYRTLAPEYIEAAWWTLKKAHEKSLLSSDNRVISWCPRCETALAEAEIEYADETDPSIYVKFPLKNEKGVSLLIWTTTPWTLPANMGVAAHPDHEYAKVRFKKDGAEDTVIMMKSLIEAVGAVGEWEGYEVLETYMGEDIEGMEYIPPLYEEIDSQRTITGEWIHKVLLSDTVEEDMTGLVHIAPGHGPEDFEIGKRYGIPLFCPVDGSGRFVPEVGEHYAGMKVKEANPLIIENLESKGLMFFSGKIEHRYGHCWRCRSTIIYRNTNQWYLRITEVKDKMLEEIARVDWVPEWAGSSREYDWTMNARDWCISRQRYWGIPIPVWTCSCGKLKVIGSADDLKGAEGYEEGMDLHRPWIDNVTFDCECGGKMKRVPDVLDVWFDAGVASWAALGWPRKTEEFERWWPAKFITEAHDQTRGWFYSQLGSSCVAFDRAPYDRVLMHGWMLDAKGLPMSKSRGNVVEPHDVITEYGADALRFYLLRVSSPWEDVSFQYDGVKSARKTLNILWNVASFASTYMALDSFDPQSQKVSKDALRPEDLWLISRTEKLKMTVTENLDSLDIHKACRALEDFILGDLSRWYVRLIRDRMWSESTDEDKLAAYNTLHSSLMAVVKLLSPFCPHITDEIYMAMDGSKETIHMLDWPTVDKSLIDDNLEASMELMQELVEDITRERQKNNVKLRWPLRRIVVRINSPEVEGLIKRMEEVLLSQANVKEIEYSSDNWDELLLVVSPVPKPIGHTYKQASAKIIPAIKEGDARAIKAGTDAGAYMLEIDGETYEITEEMVSYNYVPPSDVIAVPFSHGDLYIDFNLDEDLKLEGYAREVIRRIQQMRKDMKLDVESFVSAEINAGSLADAVSAWKEHIMKETRSTDLIISDAPAGEYSVDWDIEGEKVVIALTPSK